MSFMSFKEIKNLIATHVNPSAVAAGYLDHRLTGTVCVCLAEWRGRHFPSENLVGCLRNGYKVAACKLPRNAIGKTMKRELLERVRARLEWA